MNNGRLAVDVESSFKDKEVEANEPELTEEDVRGLLYTVESLRKVVTGPDDEAGSEAPHGNAESDVAADNTGEGEE
jgi:tRNA (guanine-N(7)-)-methyltransferase subunit TRM82